MREEERRPDGRLFELSVMSPEFLMIYLLTGGLLLLGVLYDLWTLNGQVDERNR